MKFLLTLMLVVVAAAAPARDGEPGRPEKPAMPDAPMYTGPFAEFVAPADSLPRLRFFEDGQVSLNDRCPVRRVKLNPKMGAHYVNGRPVGFC